MTLGGLIKTVGQCYFFFEKTKTHEGTKSIKLLRKKLIKKKELLVTVFFSFFVKIGKNNFLSRNKLLKILQKKNAISELLFF
jgi:hypothetical protein